MVKIEKSNAFYIQMFTTTGKIEKNPHFCLLGTYIIIWPVLRQVDFLNFVYNNFIPASVISYRGVHRNALMCYELAQTPIQKALAVFSFCLLWSSN